MSDPVTLQLNPDLDPKPFAEIYAREGLVQIPDILPAGTADAIHDMLAKHIQWRLVFPSPADANAVNHGAVEMLTQQDIQALGPEGMRHKIQGVLTKARENIGYLYSSYPMIQAYTGGWDQGHPIHAVTEFLNSPGFLEFGRRVIGVDKLTKADAQATLYAPGNFLTRHIDDGMDNERRCAYTFGFTRNWQTDWGGLLMLLDENQDIERGLLPRFNVLSLFDGRKIHSVSAVTQFAGAGRYQITGWLRDDPPVGQA